MWKSWEHYHNRWKRLHKLCSSYTSKTMNQKFSITVKECMFQKWTNWERVEGHWDSAEYHQHPTAHFKQKDIYWCCRGLPQPSLSLAPSIAITHKPSSSAHSGYHWLVNVKAGAWGLGSFSPVCSIVSRPTLSTLASQEVMWRSTTERVLDGCQLGPDLHSW